ncbi:hypothetical protein SLS60_009147 [Paraconiothyrium brasiliense]|uniref:aldehyde dehydrogenase (NAD(+)) n=1 Tax=Paraconiothyrium brasiliense TaxID=300254 RepID=A0ABR3QWF8_9PLEO
MFIWKISPAIATGNTVVIKCAESTSLMALKCCELIKEAGIWLRKDRRKCNSESHGCRQGRIHRVNSHWTNNFEVSASSNLKKVTLELGGKSPDIVFPDADIQKAVDWSAWGINMNFGQTCHAGTRIYVHEDVYDEFVAAYTKRMGSLKVGDNFDENVDQGPQNSKTQFEKILGYIESGKEEGATISLGGEVAEVENGEGRGYYIQPTIFTDMKPQMKAPTPCRSLLYNS